MLKLKIALLSYRSDPFSGGQGIYLKNLSDSLIRRGHKITIFSGNPFNVRIASTNAAAAGVGSGISFMGRWNDTESQYADLAIISGIKENNTDDNYAGALVLELENLGPVVSRWKGCVLPQPALSALARIIQSIY